MTFSSSFIPPGSPVRIGDRERSEAADRLAAHAAAGRLGVEELEQRLERAHGAVFAHELAAVEADLPGRREPSRGRRPPLLAAALACLLAGVLLSVLVGHPVPPLLIGAFLLWRAGRWTPAARFRPIGA
jgi:hypothetical protein